MWQTEYTIFAPAFETTTENPNAFRYICDPKMARWKSDGGKKKKLCYGFICTINSFYFSWLNIHIQYSDEKFRTQKVYLYTVKWPKIFQLIADNSFLIRQMNRAANTYVRWTCISPTKGKWNWLFNSNSRSEKKISLNVETSNNIVTVSFLVFYVF